MTLKFVAFGPLNGDYYAGYWRKKMHALDVFVPMAQCTSERQAQEAADQFNKEAAERERQTAMSIEMLNMPREQRRAVHGFYSDDE